MRTSALLVAVVLATTSHARGAILESAYNTDLTTINGGAMATFRVSNSFDSKAGAFGWQGARLFSVNGRIDTAAQTGQLFGDLAIVPKPAPGPINSRLTLITVPPMFPNPAQTMDWFVRIQYTATLDGIPTIASSTPAPLVPQDALGTSYIFRPLTQIAMPETLSLVASYEIQGPSTTVGPFNFSQTYRRTSGLASVTPGVNVNSPYGAVFGAFTMGQYAPEAPPVITHTVDGATFRMEFNNPSITLVQGPEPSAGVLSGLAMLGFAAIQRSVRRRSP